MAGSGSGKRNKDSEILVRLDTEQNERLAELALEADVSRQELLRRWIDNSGRTRGPSRKENRLAATDRAALADCHRSMGHLAGMLKRAVFEFPATRRHDEIVRILNQHHDDLQTLQTRLRAFVESQS